jgi:hypothetical protein
MSVLLAPVFSTCRWQGTRCKLRGGKHTGSPRASPVVRLRRLSRVYRPNDSLALYYCPTGESFCKVIVFPAWAPRISVIYICCQEWPGFVPLNEPNRYGDVGPINCNARFYQAPCYQLLRAITETSKYLVYQSSPRFAWCRSLATPASAGSPITNFHMDSQTKEPNGNPRHRKQRGRTAVSVFQNGKPRWKV